MAELDSKNREHKSVQDRLDTEVRKKSEIDSKQKTKGHELEEAQKRLEKLTEHIKGSENQLEEQQRVYDDLQVLVLVPFDPFLIPSWSLL